jgi:hypothetical protein
MVRCVNGHENPDGSRYCNACGLPIAVPGEGVGAGSPVPPVPPVPLGKSRRPIWRRPAGIAILALAGALLLGSVVQALNEDGGFTPGPGPSVVTVTPSLPTQTTNAPPAIEDLDGYTCDAIRDGIAATEQGDLDGRFDAAQRLDVAAGQWEESLPELGPTLRTLSRGLRGGMTEKKLAGTLQDVANRSFPGCLGNSEEEPTEPAAHFKTFDDGTWVVGSDIKPGVYRNANPSSGCYWERSRNFSGGGNSIIANGLDTGGPIVVQILKTDKGFTSQDCGEWTTDLSRISSSKTRIEDGIWIVGVDVTPGTYRTDPGRDCYWERMRNFTAGGNSIIANGIPSGGSAIVQINATDAGFTSQGCGTWRKV